MKKRNVIYGVSGMLEYQALIKVGSARLKVAFTNGSSNEAGRSPATYTTSNPIVQLAIENSKEYKCGFIRKVHEAITKEDVYIASEHEGKEAEVPIAENKERSVTNFEETKDETTEGVIGAVTIKEFSCNDDAKDFFENEFDAKRSTLRTRADIIAYGKKNGIDVTFTD